MFNDGRKLTEMDGVMLINKYKTLVINKKSETLQVYRVPLKYLYYNDQNDRISTALVRRESVDGPLDRGDRERYNDVFEKLIYDTRPDLLEKTKKSIKSRGQDNPGVTLMDGRVVDGNRRFTCLRLIQKETNQEQFFETVILGIDYEHNYKTVKSLELELQMGVEEKVSYDPIDRLFGVYKSIRLEKAFSVEEYAALFDNKTVKDIENDLELADLMCEYLEYIDCPQQYHIAKDMKLDGVLHEMPAVIKNTSTTNPDLVDDVKAIIFTAILAGVDTRLNLYVRDHIGKLVKKEGDIQELVESTRESVDTVRDIIDGKEQVTEEDIREIRSNREIAQGLGESIEAVSERTRGRTIQNAPLKLTREANSKIKAIVESSIPAMNEADRRSMLALLDEMSVKIDRMRKSL